MLVNLTQAAQLKISELFMTNEGVLKKFPGSVPVLHYVKNTHFTDDEGKNIATGPRFYLSMKEKIDQESDLVVNIPNFGSLVLVPGQFLRNNNFVIDVVDGSLEMNFC